MASAAMISLRGRIHKHASQEDLLTLPLPLPFASRGRGGSRDSHRNNPDRPSPRAVSITLTLLVLSMLGTLAVLNNLMRAELARELAEQQQHSKMELADGKMAGRGSRETPASVVEATNPLDEADVAEEAAAKEAAEEGLVRRDSAAVEVRRRAEAITSSQLAQTRTGGGGGGGANRAAQLHGREACELVLHPMRGGPDGEAATGALSADTPDARCLREQTDVHAADVSTSMEDKRTCRRLARLQPADADGGVLEWNATGSPGGRHLPSVEQMIAAWQADKAIVLRGGATGFGAAGKWDSQFLLDHALPIKSFRVRRSKYHDGVYHFNNRDYEMSSMSFADFHRASEAGEELYLAETSIASFGKSNEQREEMLRDLRPPHALAIALEQMGVPADRCMPVRHQLWMGNGLKVNPLHQDPYDNLLLQLSGEKHFTLYAPSQRWWLYPTFPPGGHESSFMNDIRRVDAQRFPCFQFARAITLTLRAGDVLLLPYGWWHQVQTTGRSLAVNYWWTRDSTNVCQRWP